MSTVKVMPWGEGQGDHVIINAEDFDPEFHTKFSEASSDVGLNEKIKDALSLLDHTNDEHWTAAGLPEVRVVKDLVGESVSRADIEAVAPELRRNS